MATRSSVFGSPLRDQILTILAMNGQSHVREITRILKVNSQSIAYTVKQLEQDGLITAADYSPYEGDAVAVVAALLNRVPP